LVSDSCTRTIIRLGVLQVLTTIGLAASPPHVGAQERVYLTREEALSRGLRGAGEVREAAIDLTAEQAQRLQTETGVDAVDSTYVFHQAVSDGRVERSVVFVNVMGQYQPISIYVAIGAGGSVERVEIVAYRESRGGEVRRNAFLQQFAEKSVDDRLRPGDDIMNITGATISSRAVSRGVRLALRLHQMLGANS
jgi:Na+-translocating ferredoxin:NAD+ oxidoreductase RnfG subunit